jgi:hypothetical protein
MEKNVDVYNPDFNLGLEIYIETSNEYGFFGNDNLPAHVHVKGSDGTEISEININGLCPRNINNVPIFNHRLNSEKEYIKYCEKILKWANSIKIKSDGSIKTYWEYAQDEWKRLEKEGIFNK